MWLLVMVAGVVVTFITALVAGSARHAGLAGVADAAGLPVLGAFFFVGLGLARHDSARALALLLLTYAAGIVIEATAGFLAGRARRAGRPGLGRFAESAGWAALGASLMVAWRLALHQGVGWTTPAAFLLGWAVYVGWLTVRRRRRDAG